MAISKVIILVFLGLFLTSCNGKKEVRYYPESIPPFLHDEIEVDEVFTGDVE